MTNRLEQFEKMLLEVKGTLKEIEEKMEVLKAEGKIKSATYHQLMANRHTYKTMVTLYQQYGLMGVED